MNVADYGHDLKGVPICVVLVAFAEERSAACGSRSGCAIDPVIRSEPRDGWAGGLVWSFGQVGQLARRMSCRRSWPLLCAISAFAARNDREEALWLLGR